MRVSDFSQVSTIYEYQYGKRSNNMAKDLIKGANPFMPLWEHVPDGEPRVFEFNGEKRVFLYGSHDMQPSFPCGTN